MKKSGKLASHVPNLFKQHYYSLATLQISLGIVAFFEKIYYGEQMLTLTLTPMLTLL
jgi:hypothetical protein